MASLCCLWPGVGAHGLLLTASLCSLWPGAEVRGLLLMACLCITGPSQVSPGPASHAVPPLLPLQ